MGVRDFVEEPMSLDRSAIFMRNGRRTSVNGVGQWCGSSDMVGPSSPLRMRLRCCLRRRSNAPNTASPRKARPPTTPPAMAPVAAVWRCESPPSGPTLAGGLPGVDVLDAGVA